MKKRYYTYEVLDLPYPEYRKAVNFAFSLARNPDVCKESSVKRDRVAVRLFDPPTGELLERLTALGFKEG